MAVVRHATDLRTNQRVAVKMPQGATAIPRPQERFEREVALMSKVQHPNCMRLLDAGFDPVPFAVLELLDGTSLRDAIHRALPAEQVLDLTLQLLRGLRAVHDAGIIHRDIKAENLMLTRRKNGTERLVLIDFGAAISASAAAGQAAEPCITEVGQVLGTPAALSPEQLHGEPASYRSDLYAVGVLMFDLLTFESPFPEANVIDLMLAKGGPPPPLPKDVPASVGWMVRSLLARDPQRRPESCTEAIEIVMYARDMMLQTMGTQTWFDLVPVRAPNENDE